MDKVLALFSNSGFTAVLASLGAVLITGIFSMQIDKRREQHKFIRQILPERIKAHSIIYETLIEMLEKLVRIVSIRPEDRLDIIVESYKRFNALLLRNSTWTDSEVSKYCWKIQEILFSLAFNEDKISFKKEITNQEYFDFMGKFTVYNEHINKRITAISGITLLDEILSKMEVKPKKKSRQSSCKSKGVEVQEQFQLT